MSLKAVLNVMTLQTLWTVARQAPLSMRFLWQEYWSGLPLPSPRDVLNSRIESMSPALQVDSLPLSHRGSPRTRGGRFYTWKRLKLQLG